MCAGKKLQGRQHKCFTPCGVREELEIGFLTGRLPRWRWGSSIACRDNTKIPLEVQKVKSETLCLAYRTHMNATK